jgi:hypothetical protein
VEINKLPTAILWPTSPVSRLNTLFAVPTRALNQGDAIKRKIERFNHIGIMQQYKLLIFASAEHKHPNQSANALSKQRF